jgi:hypothetical protein
MTVNMLWFLLFNAFSVYFASQTLQMSHYIKNTAHNTVSSFSLVYDALYSIIIVFGLHYLHKTPGKKLSILQKCFYTFFCHCGAIIFALCGEVSFLEHFSLTKGFWERLPWEGKIIIGCVAIILANLVLIQGCKSRYKKNCSRQWFPWIFLSVLWFVLWFLLYDEKIKAYIHVHHALFAGFFSCWFEDFSFKLDIVLNAILIGIVIEGIDFYGIGELTLFMMDQYSAVDISGLLTTWVVVFVGLLGSICCTKNRVIKTNELNVQIIEKLPKTYT